jgi:hypothetical protein
VGPPPHALAARFVRHWVDFKRRRIRFVPVKLFSAVIRSYEIRRELVLHSQRVNLITRPPCSDRATLASAMRVRSRPPP